MGPGFYNGKRLHSSVGYRSQVSTESSLQAAWPIYAEARQGQTGGTVFNVSPDPVNFGEQDLLTRISSWLALIDRFRDRVTSALFLP